MGVRERVDTSAFLEARSRQDTERLRAAQRSGRLPAPARVVSSRRAEAKVESLAQETVAPAPPPPRMVQPTIMQPAEGPRACSVVRVREMAEELRRCDVTDDELRELLRIGDNGIPLCIAIGGAAICFALGYAASTWQTREALPRALE